MSAAVVLTQAGGAFRLTDAFMIGMDHIGHGRKGNTFNIYAIQDGDNVTFVQDAKAIRHTFPDGTQQLITGGTKATPVRFIESDAAETAERFRINHPGHRFDLVPFPGE